MVGRLCFFLGGGGILRTDNISFEWLSLCQGAEIFFDCLKCFGGGGLQYFRGRGVEIYQDQA